MVTKVRYCSYSPRVLVASIQVAEVLEVGNMDMSGAHGSPNIGARLNISLIQVCQLRQPHACNLCLCQNAKMSHYQDLHLVSVKGQ